MGLTTLFQAANTLGQYVTRVAIAGIDTAADLGSSAINYFSSGMK